MVKPLTTSLVRSGVVFAAITLVSPSAIPAAAQTRGAAKAPQGSVEPVRRLPDGTPDLNGVWISGDGAPNPVTTSLAERLAVQRQQEAAGRVPQLTPLQRLYTPAALAKMKTLSDKDDPGLKCVPSVSGQGGEWQFVQTQSPQLLAILNETYHGFRIIPTAPGRKHNDDFPPGYFGDSVGRWEGDTLVVDVNNFTDRNWIGSEGNISFHSDALHVVERYHVVDANTLEVEKTYQDPKVLTGPWVEKKTLTRAPFDQIIEALCLDTTSATLMEGAAKEGYGRQPAPVGAKAAPTK